MSDLKQIQEAIWGDRETLSHLEGAYRNFFQTRDVGVLRPSKTLVYALAKKYGASFDVVQAAISKLVANVQYEMMVDYVARLPHIRGHLRELALLTYSPDGALGPMKKLTPEVEESLRSFYAPLRWKSPMGLELLSGAVSKEKRKLQGLSSMGRTAPSPFSEPASLGPVTYPARRKPSSSN